MKTIHLTYPNNYDEVFPPLVMALGYFDGIHRGHEQVIRTAKQIALQTGRKSAVMTFFPHPSVVLGRATQHIRFITPPLEKEQVIAILGIDYLFVVEFSKKFAELLPQQFIDEYIIRLNTKQVVAGFDYTYGRMGKGTMETMPFHSREQFACTAVEKCVYNNEKVSSTKIRENIALGDVSSMPTLLGRFYKISGEVVHGEKRGRTIGFPTANIDLSGDYLIPATGVYAVKVKRNGIIYSGVCNIGHKPTFHQDQKELPTVEVHIFDFSEDIYGEILEVEWYQRIRSEQKFSGIQELIEQIEKDKQTALAYFEK